MTGTGSFFNPDFLFYYYYFDSEIFKKPEPTDINKIKYPGNNYVLGLIIYLGCLKYELVTLFRPFQGSKLAFLSTYNQGFLF
jgi:hypothetical protein